jgi:hypothetical protein
MMPGRSLGYLTLSETENRLGLPFSGTRDLHCHPGSVMRAYDSPLAPRVILRHNYEKLLVRIREKATLPCQYDVNRVPLSHHWYRLGE